MPAPGLDPVHAAPLTDAALTSYHAVKLSLDKLRPGSTALVLGVGGLGHMAIQILKAITAARVLAVDVRDAALELAREAGADAVLSADGLTPAGVRAELGPDGATVALDFVGTDATLELAAGSVAQGGDVAYVGRGGGELRGEAGADPVRVSPCACRPGARWRSWPRSWRSPRAGAIHSEAEVYGLDEAVAAYGRLKQGDVVGRAVISAGAYARRLGSLN